MTTDTCESNTIELEAKEADSAPATTPDSQSVIFHINANILKGMNLFSSVDETHPILRAVCLDYTKEVPVLVSTDGRRLAVYSLDEDKALLALAKGKQWLLPSSLIKHIPSGVALGKITDPVEITFNPNNTVRFALANRDGTSNFVDDAVPGGFPVWRRVIPGKRAAKASEVALNAAYVFSYQKAAEIFLSLRRTAECPLLYPHIPYSDPEKTTPSVYSVRFVAIPQFYGVIMGMRHAIDIGNIRPPWLLP